MATAGTDAKTMREFEAYTAGGNGWLMPLSGHGTGVLTRADGKDQTSVTYEKVDTVPAVRINCKRTRFDAPIVSADAKVCVIADSDRVDAAMSVKYVPACEVARGDVLATPVPDVSYSGMTHFRVEDGTLVAASADEPGARPITREICMLAGALAMTGYAKSASKKPGFAFSGDEGSVRALFLDAANEALGSSFTISGKTHGTPLYMAVDETAVACRSSVALAGCMLVSSPLVHASKELDDWLLAGMMEARNQYTVIYRPKVADSCNTRWVTSSRDAFALLTDLLAVRGISLGLTSAAGNRLKLEVNATGHSYDHIAKTKVMPAGQYVNLLSSAFSNAMSGMGGNAMPMGTVNGTTYMLHPVTSVFRFDATAATVFDVPDDGVLFCDAAVMGGQAIVSFEDSEGVTAGTADHRSARSLRADIARGKREAAAVSVPTRGGVPISDIPRDVIERHRLSQSNDGFDDIVMSGNVPGDDASAAGEGRHVLCDGVADMSLAVSPNTLVKTPDGFVMASDLSAGDEIVTDDGGTTHVAKVLAVRGDAVNITTAGGSTGCVGAWLRVLVRTTDGIFQVPANKLVRGSTVTFPWGDALSSADVADSRKWLLSEYIGKRQGHIPCTVDGQAVIRWLPRNGGTYLFPDVQRPSAPLLYLLGALCVNGGLNSGMMRIALSGDYCDARAKRLARAIGDAFGGMPGSITEAKTTVLVRVVSPVVSSMLAAMLGIGAMRSLPVMAMTGDPADLRRVILGAIDARGRISRDGRSVVISVRNEYGKVMGQLQHLCMVCGIHSSLSLDGSTWRLSFARNQETGGIDGIGREWEHPSTKRAGEMVVDVRRSYGMKLVGIVLEDGNQKPKSIVTASFSVMEPRVG